MTAKDDVRYVLTPAGKLVKKYMERIADLKAENERLRKELMKAELLSAEKDGEGLLVEDKLTRLSSASRPSVNEKEGGD